jgi:L-ascorbate metabolism protein UlaG (beta-lactamase superfamily)
MLMSLERYGHSCVVLRTPGGSIVIDPGSFSDSSEALTCADAVLITHEHADHLQTDVVAASGLPVWGPAEVVRMLVDGGADPERLHSVVAGDVVEPAGIRVEVLGETHETIHPDLPRLANVGYLVAGSVLHPGDAYVDVPEGTQVAVCLVPISGPWLRISDVVDWVRRVAPDRVVPIHDALLSPPGARLALSLVERLCDSMLLVPGAGERVAV